MQVGTVTDPLAPLRSALPTSLTPRHSVLDFEAFLTPLYKLLVRLLPARGFEMRLTLVASSS